MAREWLYGRQAVLAALMAGRRRCYSLLIAQGVATKGTVADILEAARMRDCEAIFVPRQEITRRVGGSKHQGVCLQVSAYPYVEAHDVLERVRERGPNTLLLFLDHLQDPQNVGNLLRTAEIAGVTAVVLPRRRAAGITPTVVNASAGAVEFLHVAQVTNLVRTVEAVQEMGVWVYGLEGSEAAVSYWEADLRGAVGLIVGSEGEGLHRLLRQRSDGLLRIPMWGQTPSLNAAVAGALALYEVRRQREMT